MDSVIRGILPVGTLEQDNIWEVYFHDSRLKGIKAIKTGQVFKIPSFIFSWDVPTPEALLGIMWLANKIYPSGVDFDLKEEIRSFYSTMYDYTPSQSEIISILDKE